MNEQVRAAALKPCPDSDSATPGVDLAATLLHRRLRRFEGQLALRLWEGALLKLGRTAHHGAPEPRYPLICRNSNRLLSMVLGRDPPRMAKASRLISNSGRSTVCALSKEERLP